MSQHIEIERATLACMVASPRAAEKVRDLLETRDFTLPTHQDIYSSMVDMVDEGRRIDELTLMAELRSAGWGDDVYAVAQGLYGVAASLASVEHAEEYALVVRDHAIRRSLERGLDGAMSLPDVTELVASAETAVFAARSRMQGDGGLDELTGASLLSPLDDFLSASRTDDGLPYPIPYMREKYGLFERGRLCYLGGPSGDGKTTMAFQWVEEMCEAGGRVAVYELEMTKLAVSRLLVLQGAGITPRQAKGLDAMSAEDSARYEERKRQVAGWDLTVKCGPVTPSQIRADQTHERYDAIFVDHMHKFARTKAGEYGDLTRYSGELHRITRDLDTSIVCLLQLNKPQKDMRTGQPKTDPPTTASLRGAGAMEEDADEVLFVWRERDLSGRRKESGLFIIGKMRDGETDTATPIVLDTGRVKFFEFREAVGPSVLSRQGVA